MIIDGLLALSQSQNVKTTTPSTNVIDLSTNRDIGAGTPIYAAIFCNDNLVASGDVELVFQLVISANSSLTPSKVISSTDVFTAPELVKGRHPIVFPIPQSNILNMPLGLRYMGLVYNFVTGAATSSSFSCYLTNTDISSNKFYSSGTNSF